MMIELSKASELKERKRSKMALFCVWIWAQTSKKVYNSSRIIICKISKGQKSTKGPKSAKTTTSVFEGIRDDGYCYCSY